MINRRNGKYLAVFDTREEAMDYLDSLVELYLTAENKYVNTPSQLTRAARRKGIHLTMDTFRRYLRNKGVTKEQRLYTPRNGQIGRRKISTTVTLLPGIHDALKQFPTVTLGIEVITRLFLGLKTNDVFVVFDDTLRVLFHLGPDGYEAIVFGEVAPRDSKVIKQLLRNIEEKGLQSLLDFCILYNHFKLGPYE